MVTRYRIVFNIVKARFVVTFCPRVQFYRTMLMDKAQSEIKLDTATLIDEYTHISSLDDCLERCSRTGWLNVKLQIKRMDDL